MTESGRLSDGRGCPSGVWWLGDNGIISSDSNGAKKTIQRARSHDSVAKGRVIMSDEGEQVCLRPWRYREQQKVGLNNAASLQSVVVQRCRDGCKDARVGYSPIHTYRLHTHTPTTAQLLGCWATTPASAARTRDPLRPPEAATKSALSQVLDKRCV